jgi:hypothetical protein
MDLWWNHSPDNPIIKDLVAQIAHALLLDRNGTGIYAYFQDPNALTTIFTVSCPQIISLATR